MLTLAMLAGATLKAEQHNPNTDWFRDAGWGVFVHYLWGLQNGGNRTNNLGRTTSWDECVKEFDTEKFADQIKQSGAPYVFFTMMQVSRYLIAPNATYDKLTGYQPGEACSTRDLVADLYRSLDKRGIKLMLYWTGDGPRADAQAAKGMGGWSGQVTDQYVANWASVAREYSLRYGDKVKGWWADGCYAHIAYNEQRWAVMAKALKAGNARAIVALNNPQMTRSNSSTTNDDYTTGEQNSFTEIPDSRWRDGVQWHVLSYLGPDWGTPGLKYTAADMGDYVRKVNGAGGVVTIDVALFRDGSIAAQQLATLKAMSIGLKKQGATTNAPARFIENLRGGQKQTIVTLGTSLTGGTWRWVTVMKDWLDADFPGLVTIHNLGVGASASSHPPGQGGLDTVKRCAELKPDAVFIEFAVNDAFLPFKISLEDSKRNLNTMVDTVLAANPGAEVVVQITSPVLDVHAADRPRLAEYCEGYREVARRRGLILVDNYPNWLKLLESGRDQFLKRVPDGIHPQEPGYREVVLPELKRVLKRET